MRKQDFLLIIFALITIFVSGSVLAVTMGWVQLLEQANAFLAVADNRWGVLAVSVFALLLSLWAVVTAVQVPRERDLVIDQSGLGSVGITATALENLIRRAVRDLRDIREVKPVLRSDAEGLVVTLQLNVNPDATLPDISREAQQIVQEHLESKAGIQVSKVKVLIQSVSADVRPRVE